MEIPNITSKIVKNTKNAIKKAKETYQESIKPKISELIDNTIEYANENYPKAKEKVAQVYTKVKNEAQETLYDINEAFKQYTLKKPKAIKLKEDVYRLQGEFAREKAKLSLLKTAYPQEREKIRAVNKNLKRIERELQKAEKEYNEFLDIQKAAQNAFDEANGTSK